MNNTRYTFAALTIALLSSSTVLAGGYSLTPYTNWSAGMSNAGSGVIDDALGIYANPASMGQVKQHQVAGGLSWFSHRSKFTGTASIPEIGDPDDDGSGGDDTLDILYATSATGTLKNRRKALLIPSFGLISNADRQLKVGVIVHSPFGFRTDYGTDSITRGYITKTALRTVNITPSVAYSPFDFLTVGSGMQIQYSQIKHARKAMLYNEAMTDDGLGDVVDYDIPSFIGVEGNDWSVGWTAGLFAQITSKWKVGLSYKSKLTANIDGTGDISPQSPLVFNGDSSFFMRSKIYFPQSFSFSTSYAVTNLWAVFADVTYSNWNRSKDIHIRSVGTDLNYDDAFNLDWKNSWTVSLGTNYRLNDCWSIRAGYGYDGAPTRAASIYFPTTRSNLFSVGTTYHASDNFDLTVSYGYKAYKRGKISYSKGSTPTLPALGEFSETASGIPTRYLKGDLSGRVKNHSNVVSAQFNYRF